MDDFAIFPVRKALNVSQIGIFIESLQQLKKRFLSLSSCHIIAVTEGLFSLKCRVRSSDNDDLAAFSQLIGIFIALQ